MYHKISEFCDKIDSIKKDADKLREMKYGAVKSSKIEIDNLIQQIQADCFLVSQDKGNYEKIDNSDSVEYIDANGVQYK